MFPICSSPLILTQILKKSLARQKIIVCNAKSQKLQLAGHNFISIFQKYADVYVKVMKRIQEKGIKWVDSEIKRIEKNLEDKSIKDDLKTNMRSRQNILESFKYPTKPSHDEL